MEYATCDACGYPKQCHVDYTTEVNEYGDYVEAKGHVCPDCLRMSDGD